MTVTTEQWRHQAAALEFRNQAFIDGDYVDAISGETYDCVTPISGDVLTAVASCATADVDRAARAARRSFEDRRWADAAPEHRKRVLLRLAELLMAHREELALLDTLDVGKPIADSYEGDVPIAADGIQYFAEAVDKVAGEVAPTAGNVTALVTHEPFGVVGCVVPWNFPLGMAVWKMAPALAAGNSVILKPAEQSPLSMLRVAELAAEAGVPDGVFNVVPGFGERAGAAIGLHMDIDKVAFTGSTEVGRLFLRYASESNMKSVSLECGGKTPNVVLGDAPDLDVVASTVARGIFFNQGEVCNAGSRLVVHRSVHDEVLDRVVKLAADYQPGDPLDPETRLGALVDHAHMERVLHYIQTGRDEGASIRIGGRRGRPGSPGYYVEPTVFDDVQNHMTIAQEEIFGPVLSVITFADVDEAIRIANDSIYGLAATVWSRDLATALSTAKAIRAGTVCVNSWAFGRNQVPFGGFKQSGSGRDQSLHALRQYTLTKTTWIDITP